MKIKAQINLNFHLILPIFLHLIKAFSINNNNKIIKMAINIFKTQINNTFNSSITCNNRNNINMIKIKLNIQTKTMTYSIKKRSKKDMLARLMWELDTLEEIKIMKIITKKDKKQNLLIIMKCLKNSSQMKKMGLLSSHSMQVSQIMKLLLYQMKMRYLRKKRMTISIKQNHQEGEEEVDLL